MYGNGIGDEGAKALATALAAGHFTGLQQLDLSYNSIGAEGAKALANALAAVHYKGNLSISNYFRA